MSYLLHQQNIPLAYIEQLPQTNPSVGYRNSDKVPQFGLWEKVKTFFTLGKRYQQLAKFYPYLPVVATSAAIFEEDCRKAVSNGLLISAVAIFTMFQFARRGMVLPVLNQYGRFFKTHRIFRQYVWAAILPTTLLYTIVELEHFENVYQLWGVHARRLQKGILTDPAGTIYPKDLLGKSQSGALKTPYINLIDLQQKLANEVELRDAPLYSNPEFQAVEIGEGEGEGESDAEDQAAEEQ